MRNIKSIFVFYLTVAVVIAVAVMPFSSGSVLQEILLAEGNTVNSEENVNSDGEKYLSDVNVSEDREMSEVTSEPFSELIYADMTDNSLQEKTDASDDGTLPENKEAVNSDEAFADFSDAEITYSEEETAQKENPQLSENSATNGFISIENDSDNEYIPGNANENVYGLNFFTETQGYLETYDSVNVYEFTLDNRSVFRYTVNHEEFTGSEGWNVDLYAEYFVNGDGNETAYRLVNMLATTKAKSDPGVELGLPAGNYRLVVTKGKVYSGSVYSIRVDCDESSAYEVECNDNIYRYTEIYSGVPLKGSASFFNGTQDEDWYMFRMYEDGYIELQFTHPAEKDKLTVCWQVIFYSEDMTSLFSVNSTFDNGEFDSGRIGLEKGNYYIAVINRVYTDITYTLNIDRTNVSDHENERNDTPETANVISPNSTMLGVISSQINGIDVDYYKFTLEKPGTVYVEFSHTPIEDDDDRLGWNYSLTDDKGNVLFCSASAWIDDVSVSSLTGLGTGTYYIRVDSEGIYHNTEKYYLTLIYEEQSDWETEYNDSYAFADKLSLSVAVNGLLAERDVDSDFDYYTFEISSASDVSIVFSHENRSNSREIFVFTLYDENKNAVITDIDGNQVSKISIKADQEEVTAVYKSLAPGKYYVRVATGIFFDAIGYSILYKTS